MCKILHKIPFLEHKWQFSGGQYFQTILILSDDLDSQPLRQKRLGHDLRGLLSDASEGIRAKPLDSSYYHWQASITGIII